MVKEALKKNILKRYHSLKHPGSYQGISVFRKSSKDNAGINISHAALRRILKSSLPYQTNFIKPKKFQTRKLYSRGYAIEAYCDPAFIPYKNDGKTKTFIALVVVDVHTRMLYATKLPRVNPKTLKLAFTRLFKAGMPKFDIVRIDRDKSLNKLRHSYFAKHGIMLLT